MANNQKQVTAKLTSQNLQPKLTTKTSFDKYTTLTKCIHPIKGLILKHAYKHPVNSRIIV